MSDTSKQHVRQYFSQLLASWNRFWFVPCASTTLSLIRVLVGCMLVYTHLVWTGELATFFSATGVFPTEYQSAYNGGTSFVWSHFYWSDSPTWLFGSHILALCILIAFTIGLWLRWTGILAFLVVVSYANRAGGALFGLDQINGFLTLYLAIACLTISPKVMRYSVDSWLAKRKQQQQSGQGIPISTAASETTMANVVTRLIQLHLCVVYLFAGLGKLQGVSWWDGTAIWGALASYEYQTLDMTWIVHLPWLVNVVTLVSVFWELSYAFMIWHRLSRPVYLALAFVVHLGIGMAMGMMTFGLIMLIANLAFLSPDLTDGVMNRLGRMVRAGTDESAGSIEST